MNKNIHLLAYYSMHPKPRVNTTVKGWMDNPDNIRYDERIEITRGLKKNSVNAKIVLDLNNKKVVKNNFTSEKTFDEHFQYFFEGYHKYLTEVMTQLDPEYLTNFVNRVQQEMDNAETETK